MTDIVYAQGLWEKVCDELKRIFPSDVYEMWFGNSRIFPSAVQFFAGQGPREIGRYHHGTGGK